MPRLTTVQVLKLSLKQRIVNTTTIIIRMLLGQLWSRLRCSCLLDKLLNSKLITMEQWTIHKLCHSSYWPKEVSQAWNWILQALIRQQQATRQRNKKLLRINNLLKPAALLNKDLLAADNTVTIQMVIMLKFLFQTTTLATGQVAWLQNPHPITKFL